MPTVSDHASLIIAKAAEIDPIVEQLRELLQGLASDEAALHREAITVGPIVADHIEGRRRIAHYALSLVADFNQPDPAMPRLTTRELAVQAWEEFLS